MTVVNQQTLELAQARSSRDQYRNYPAESYGKIRSIYAQIGTVPGALYTTAAPALAPVAGDATSTIDLMFIPYARIRFLPYLAVVRTNIATSTLKIGIRQYTTQPKQTVIAEDADVFTNEAGGVTLSGAAATAPIAAGTLMDFNVFSNKGVTLFATLGAAILTSSWLEFRCAFISE